MVTGLNDLLNLYHSRLHFQSNEGLARGTFKIKLRYPATASVELSLSVFYREVKIKSMTALNLFWQTGRATKDIVKLLHRMCSRKVE